MTKTTKTTGDTFTVSLARTNRGNFHLARRPGGLGLEPVCGARPAQRMTGLADPNLSIADAYDAFIGIDRAVRCDKCWDEGLRIKHPIMRRKPL